VTVTAIEPATPDAIVSEADAAEAIDSVWTAPPGRPNVVMAVMSAAAIPSASQYHQPY